MLQNFFEGFSVVNNLLTTENPTKIQPNPTFKALKRRFCF